MSHGVELRPGDPSYEARAAGCTCTWLRGFGVGDPLESWVEEIIYYDADCSDSSHAERSDEYDLIIYLRSRAAMPTHGYEGERR